LEAKESELAGAEKKEAKQREELELQSQTLNEFFDLKCRYRELESIKSSQNDKLQFKLEDLEGKVSS